MELLQIDLQSFNSGISHHRYDLTAFLDCRLEKLVELIKDAPFFTYLRSLFSPPIIYYIDLELTLGRHHLCMV